MNYYIFGDDNIEFDINLKQDNVKITIKNSSSNISFKRLKTDLKDLLDYLEKVEQWQKKSN